jgi:hypothetical protein
MPKTLEVYAKKILKIAKKLIVWLWKRFVSYWKHSFWHKIIVVIVAVGILCLGVMYGIAQWYIYSERNIPYTMGVTFAPDYATSLGVNPQQTLSALINDMGVRNFRLVSYWSDIEPTPGHYNFTELDSEFKQIDAVHGHIELVIGLRQPRWPECHPPNWVNTSVAESQWEPELKQFMATVINRYKNNPALTSYELENEYLLKAFGDCTNFDRSRLVSEFNLVKKLDPGHPVIISRSNNAIGTPIGQPTPDEYSISIYKRVWSGPIGRYLEYPFPSWYYAFLAGVEKIVNHKDMIINEMQAEPWAPNGKTITQISLAEQSKSLNASSLQQRFVFAKATGMRTVYFWGAEYWYYRWKVEGDKSVWNVAVKEFQQADK